MNTNTKIVKLDGRQLVDSFHEYFAEIFGFPDFYGHNMDAWIDCITYLDEPSAGMCTKIFVQPGESIIFHVDHVRFLKTTGRESYDELIECVAFVNYRRIANNGTPLVYLSFFENEHR